MGAKPKVTMEFNRDAWTGSTDKHADISIGTREGEALPYELLLMALGSCLYATFQDTAKKMKAEWEAVSLEINGEKRQEVPTTLKYCSVKAFVKHPSEKNKLRKAFGIATRYCSVYQTINKVADMDWEIEFSP